jgi:lipopolysaccharide transport system ATP-binding protein
MAGDDLCVSVRGVSKKFARSLKRSFVYGARDIGRVLLRRPPDDSLRATEFWAVRDVSFDLRRGMSIGIVGQNGSGKTTLLRMICGILRPTLGTIAVHGRIAPMLALGAGFKPVLSGRQNVFLNLALLGVAERDIRARFDAIVDFAELHEAIDAPLGTYSSGMQARLGFACAVHTDPSILVVDEVLSVGDARFRVKCRNKINDLRRAGTSLLLVSHSAVLVETLSDECLFLRGGKTAGFGKPREILRAYDADAAKHPPVQAPTTAPQPATALPTKAGVHLVGVTFGGTDAEWTTGEDAALELTLASDAPFDDLSINVMVFDLAAPGSEAVLFLTSSQDAGWLQLPAGQHTVRLHLPHLGLVTGSYRIKISVSRTELHDILAVQDNLRVAVRSRHRAEIGMYHQPRSWHAPGSEFRMANEPDATAEALDE